MAPPDVSVHAARVPFAAMGPGGAVDPTIALAPVRAFSEPPHVDDAAELLASAPLDVLAFGFTSSGYAIGSAGEALMIERLRARAQRLPVVATCTSTVEALRVLERRRFGLVAPPWFGAQLNELGRHFYEQAGFEVAFSDSADVVNDPPRIEPAALFAWVVRRIDDQVDAVVIGGNGFRAVGVIEALEDELRRPVLTANQVLLWAALRAAGALTSMVEGYGQIFTAS